MSEVDDVQEIDVQPHPRLLGVLGDIEFAPWQCIAELVDNAFDDFLRHPEPAVVSTVALGTSATEVVEVPTVTVTLPAKASDPRDAEVWVSDNGSGMSLEQMNSAMRAGWTSNDRHGQLGLYGVGFNIATARLGHVAVIKTAKAEDPAWTIATLDVRKLSRDDSFKLPIAYEPKTNPNDHGTTVIIRDLKPEYRDSLSRPAAKTKIRSTLGEVYSHLLTERGFRLVIDRQAVAPRRPCLWDASRSVVRRNERIPAIINIDERLTDQHICLDCGRWQEDLEGRCESCRGERLAVRERRIWGWLGIQRYLHTSEFGIDFIRNGRKILLRDLSMFLWHDPDDPSARGAVEYPLEFPRNAGRIIGEIHIDHVRVNYQKNAFEYDSREWKKVISVLRGSGPLRPKIARDKGYEPNTSPLARLLAGYQTQDPGLKCLIPGDGKVALHDTAAVWAKHFRDGDAEFQSDERWYQAARNHDRIHDERDSAGDPPPADPTSPPPGAPGGDILTTKGLNDPPPAAPSAPAPPVVESEEERKTRWREAGQRMFDMETSYMLPGHGAALQVTAYLVRGQRLRRPDDDERVPVSVAAGRGSSVEVFVDADHEVFTDFAVETRDLVLLEIAYYLRERIGSRRALSALFSDLKVRCLPDHKLTGPLLAEVADRLLRRIRESMQPVVAGNSSGYLSRIDVEDRGAAERQFASQGGSAAWDEVLDDGEWVQYVPAAALVRLLASRPEAFMDGRVFRSVYAGLSDAQAQAVSATRLERLLGDVAILADQVVRRGSEELQRGRLSCTLLERELVSIEEAGA